MSIKILHINFSDDGGAAEAASNLHLELIKQSVHSRFLTINLNKTHPIEHRFYTHRRVYKKFVRKIWHLYIKAFFINIKTKKLTEKNPNVNELISLPYSTFNLLLDPLYEEADIIHFHLITGFIDHPSFFRKNKKPIVWTLHDRNPFSGILHCETNFPKESLKTELYFKRLKRNWYVSNLIHIVSPSSDYKFRSEKSGQFPGKIIETIFHGINHNTFHPLNKDDIRKKHNIEPGQFVIVSAASDLQRKLKGFEELLTFAKKKKNVFFIFIGDEKSKENLPNVKYTGAIKDKALLNEYYNLSDFVLSNSVEESFGLTIVEALFGNNPVLCRNVGIAKDIKNNPLLQTFSSLDLIDFNLASMTAKTRTNHNFELILDLFNISTCAEKHIELYKSLVK